MCTCKYFYRKNRCSTKRENWILNFTIELPPLEDKYKRTRNVFTRCYFSSSRQVRRKALATDWIYICRSIVGRNTRNKKCFECDSHRGFKLFLFSRLETAEKTSEVLRIELLLAAVDIMTNNFLALSENLIRKLTSPRILIFSSMLFLILIGLSWYSHVQVRTHASGHRSRYRAKVKSIARVSNGFNSCPKQFRTRQPSFVWPPQPFCDAACAIDGLEEVLPSIPWFYQYYRDFFNYTDHASDVKWFNLARFLRLTTNRLRHLELLSSEKRKFLLDIGTGFGYLPFLASHFNHCVMAIDSYSNTTGRFSHFFPGMIKILGVDLRQQIIRPFIPIDRELFSGVRFDVISAYLAWFHCSPRMWGLDEWVFFLTDLAEFHTSEKAVIYLNLNRCRYKNKTSIGHLWSDKDIKALSSKGVQFLYTNGPPTTMKINDLRAFRKNWPISFLLICCFRIELVSCAKSFLSRNHVQIEFRLAGQQHRVERIDWNYNAYTLADWLWKPIVSKVTARLLQEMRICNNVGIIRCA